MKRTALFIAGALSVVIFVVSNDSRDSLGVPPSITVDGQTIDFTWTDDNSGEDLILWSDKSTYTNGLGHAVVYTAVVNESGKEQDVQLMGYFGDGSQYVGTTSVLAEITYAGTPLFEENCIEIQSSTSSEMYQECVQVQTGTSSPYTVLEWVELDTVARTLPEVANENASLHPIARKSSNGYLANKKTAKYQLPDDGIIYFRVEVHFPANVEGNFFLEVLGDKKGYGHLDPWFNPSWSYRVEVQIDPIKVTGSSNLTNYPVYLNLANLPAGFHSNVKVDGCDIRITESDGETETPFDLVSYASSTDTGQLHFRSDSLSYNATTTFYVYYGNAAASCYAATDPFGRNAVWSDYAAVWHMEETSGDALSATGNNTGTDNNTVGTGTGQIGNGRNFVRASSEYFSIASGAQTGLGITGNAITIQAWAKGDSTLNNAIGRIMWRLGGTGSYGYQLSTSGNSYVPNNAYAISAVGTGGGFDFAFGTAGDATSGIFKHVVATYDGTNFRGYVNSASSTSATKSNHLTNANAITFNIARGASAEYYDDILDEVRVRPTVLSSDWVTTEYNNQSSPSTFYWIGAQESNVSAAEAPQDVLWFN